MEVIFKPDDATEAYFGRAKIRKNEVLNAYIAVNNETEWKAMSEKQFEKISAVTGMTTLVVVAVAAVVISLFVLAAGLAASPF